MTDMQKEREKVRLFKGRLCCILIILVVVIIVAGSMTSDDDVIFTDITNSSITNSNHLRGHNN